MTETLPQETMVWQPIESAPKDGHNILVYVESNDCTYCVAWGIVSCNVDVDPSKIESRKGWCVFGGGYREHIQEATHWMPLPEPPK